MRVKAYLTHHTMQVMYRWCIKRFKDGGIVYSTAKNGVRRGETSADIRGECSSGDWCDGHVISVPTLCRSFSQRDIVTSRRRQPAK